MSLSLDLAAAISQLTGQSFQPARTVRIADSAGLAVAVDLVQVESLGVSCEEIRVEAPRMTSVTVDVLRDWGERLCQRVRYLLEALGTIEVDTEESLVLIRSNPPDQGIPGRTRYYEVILASLGGGRFSLRRYEAIRGVPGRTNALLQVTHEQLAKLVNDLVESIVLP